VCESTTSTKSFAALRCLVEAEGRESPVENPVENPVEQAGKIQGKFAKNAGLIIRKFLLSYGKC
jgi:hypothetical protein